METEKVSDELQPATDAPTDVDPDVLAETLEEWKIDDILMTIQQDPRYDDQEVDRLKTMSDQLKAGNIMGAMTDFLDFLGWVMWSSSRQPFEYFGDDIIDVSYDVSKRIHSENPSPAQLQKQIETFAWLIDTNTKSIKRKLAYTAAMTECKNALFRKENNSDLAMQQDPAERMKFLGQGGMMKPWDVLLVNKSPDKRGFGDRLLTETVQGDVNFSHSMLISRVDEDGTVWVTHSTMKKQDGKSGVEEVKLSDYLKQFGKIENTALAVLSPADALREKLVADVRNKIGKWYDRWAAISRGILGTNLFGSNDSYNCVELIAQHIPDSSVRQFTHPSQFLSTKLLTPTYLSIGGWLAAS